VQNRCAPMSGLSWFPPFVWSELKRHVQVCCVWRFPFYTKSIGGNCLLLDRDESRRLDNEIVVVELCSDRRFNRDSAGELFPFKICSAPFRVSGLVFDAIFHAPDRLSGGTHGPGYSGQWFVGVVPDNWTSFQESIFFEKNLFMVTHFLIPSHLRSGSNSWIAPFENAGVLGIMMEYNTGEVSVAHLGKAYSNWQYGIRRFIKRFACCCTISLG